MKHKILSLLLILPVFGIAQPHIDETVNSWRLSVDEKHLIPKSIRSASSQEALTYLNILRTGSGQTSLLENTILNTSALNHSNYLITHNISGHYETAGTTGFTGVQPWERSAYAGYLSSITENVSTGQTSVQESIDGLYSAIYHRFGFQAFDIDEIGIGVNFSSTGAYTYNMGNKKLNDACSGTSFSGSGRYYTGICSDTTFKMEESVYLNVQNSNKAANPSKILWPYANQTNVPPVFFEESPDPLPDYSVSGYPISLKFNDYFIKTVSLSSFQLFDSAKNEITNTRLLTKENDPNSKITSHEFALFPLTRLNWNSQYSAKAVYSIDGVSETLEWSFTTKSVGYDYYIITTNSSEITIQPNKTYALYIVPSSKTDVLTSYTTKGTFLPKTDFIDSNTLSVSTTDAIGGKTTINLSNGKTINLTIASTDTAISQVSTSSSSEISNSSSSSTTLYTAEEQSYINELTGTNPIKWFFWMTNSGRVFIADTRSGEDSNSVTLWEHSLSNFTWTPISGGSVPKIFNSVSIANDARSITLGESINTSNSTVVQDYINELTGINPIKWFFWMTNSGRVFIADTRLGEDSNSVTLWEHSLTNFTWKAISGGSVKKLFNTISLSTDGRSITLN